MEYTELRPPDALKGFAESIWHYSFCDVTDQEYHQVLPEGCGSLVFHFNESKSGLKTKGTLSVFGPQETFSVFPITPGIKVLGVRFLPGGMKALLNIFPSEFAGTEIDLTQISPIFAPIVESLLKTDSESKIISILTTELEHRARMVQKNIHERSRVQRVREAIRLMKENQLPIAEIASRLGVSERTLHRNILDDTGIAPKKLSRIYRFRKAMQLLLGKAPMDLAKLALDCGFNDQPHMNSNFREFAGNSPGDLCRNKMERNV